MHPDIATFWKERWAMFMAIIKVTMKALTNMDTQTTLWLFRMKPDDTCVSVLNTLWSRLIPHRNEVWSIATRLWSRIVGRLWLACCCRFFYLSLHLAKRREGSKPTPTPHSTHPAAFVFTCLAFCYISLLLFPSISCILCFCSLSHTLFLLLSASFFAFIPSFPLLFCPIPHAQSLAHTVFHC